MNNIKFTHFVTRFFNIKSVLSKYISIFIFFLLFSPSQILAEGSKEVYIGDDATGLQFCNNFATQCNAGRTQFAIYECDSSDRLNFIVNSTDEIVYLGFQGQEIFGNWHIVYRIKDINGEIVKFEDNLPTSGTGYINNIDEARQGPQQLGNPAGYDAIEWTPPSTGIYYIEFNRVHNESPEPSLGSFHIHLFDITVANTTTNTAIPGRLYCQAWQFSYIDNAPCSAKFYVYSTDSIITSLQLNVMDGRWWFLYCNQTGVGNTGDFTQDRKSVGYQAYFPQYRIFLNEPDTILFPPATTLGSIIPPVIGQTHCNNGTIDFLVEVDRAGNVEIELNFDPPYITRTLSTIVEVGVNTIIWDGYDGTSPNSLPVPNNTNIEFTVSYINGLTNLPLHDIEYNTNGFVIELVYPPPSENDSLFVFWDDSNIGGTVNLNGCYSTFIPWSGCHDWNNTNDCTHNTWWYTVSQTTAPVVIIENRNPDSLTFVQQPPQSICAGASGLPFSVTTPNLSTEIYHWSFTGTGGTFNPPNPTGSSVTIDFAINATPGNIEVWGENTNCGLGDTSYLPILVQQSTIADAGPDAGICEDDTYTLSGATASNYASLLWTRSGDGTFDNATLLNATYTPGPGDISSGNVDLTLTTTSIAPCTANATDTMTLSIGPASTANAGSDATICENSTHTLSGSGTAYSSKLWTTAGDGTFDDDTLFAATYTPGTNDIIAGSVDLTLTTSPVPPCTTDSSDVMTLSFQLLPIADAGINDTICEDSNYTLSGDTTYSSALFWNTSGDGGFDDPTLLNATYTPGPGDISLGSVDLSLTAYSIAPCTIDSTDIMTLSIQIFPTANAGSDTIICETGSYTLSGIATDYSTSMWTATAGDGTFDDPTLLNATYSPGPTDISTGSVDLSLTAYSIAPCTLNAADDMTLSIQLSPIANAGSDESICERDTLDFSQSATQPSAIDSDSLLWIGGLGSFDNDTTLLPKYIPAVGELGQVDLSLIAYGTFPCSNDTSTMTLTIFDSPEADYIKNPNDSICVNELIYFQDNSTTTITNWLWDFGDGNTAYTQNVYHSYTNNGIYDVSLLVTNTNGCTDSISNTLEVHVLPNAGFTISPNDSICAEIPLTFTDTSTTNVISRIWDFGDGSPLASGGIATHTYTSPGDYNVTLIVENDNTCSDTIVKTVHVYILPIADFMISPNDTSCVDEVINFNAAGTTDIVLWEWEFGDGNTGTGQNTTHAYTQTGTFTILLIYTNNNGCSDTAIHQRVVVNPNIGFSMSPSPSCQGYLVLFNGINVGEATFTDWNWDFGDGVGTAVGHNVSYLYTQAGTFNVTLNVCSKQVVHPLTVNPTCIVDAGSDEAVCEDAPFDFSTSDTIPSASGYASILWYGGQGSFDNPTLVVPVYTPGPTELGFVTLTMIGYAISPCVNDTSQMVLQVVEGASAHAGSDENTCYNVPFDFANSSDVPFGLNYDTLYWSGGNGYFIDPNVEVPVYVPGQGEIGPVVLTMVASGFIINCDSIDEMVLTIRPEYLTPLYPVICYGDSVFAQGAWRFASGVFYDTLTSIYLCDSVIETNLTVYPEIDKDFTISPRDTSCLGEPAVFTTTGSANLSGWLWDFGNGNTSSVMNPNYMYPSQGIYDVTFSYTDNLGCSDFKVHQITVFDLPDVSFISSLTSACQNTQIDFFGSSTSNIVLWEWDFGDGQTSTGQNTSYTYTVFGNYAVTLTVTDINGCTNTAINYINVVEPPTADFTYQVYVCDTLNFTDLSTSPPGYNLVMWHWDFGDGDTSNLQNPQHVFPGGGLYNVTLIVTADSSGFLCSGSVTKPVVVPYLPTVYYTWTPEPTCFGDTTYFFGTSGNYIINWFWDFDDGHFSNLQEPTHLYDTTGTYNVLLSVTDTLGCISTIYHVVHVTEIPDVSFTMSSNPACTDDIISFYGQSSSIISLWYWDFGDGAYSNMQNPVHVYTNSGTYDVALTVTDTAGCTNTEVLYLLISSSPDVDFTYTVYQCDTLNFTDLSTTPPGYFIVDWLWDFDDGSYSNLQNPSHAFPAPGVYDVTLWATADSSGYQCTDSITLPVSVPNLPTVNFTWTPEPTCFGDTTYFFGNSGNTIITWQWDFGDGYFSSMQNPTHVYNAPGSYNVVLSITDISGCMNTTSDSVNVSDVPDVSFTMSPTQTCVDNIVSFFGQSSSVISNWHWDFGDGAVSYIQNPVHIYSTFGTYYIVLTVTDTAGCTNTAIDSIVVSQPPVADFDYQVYHCDTLDFFDLSTAPPGYFLVDWYWDFGDGGTSGAQNPQHIFPAGGVYLVTMAVTADSSGHVCTDTVTHSVMVPYPPSVFFTWTPEPTILGDITSFFGTSGDTIAEWYWDFGDGYFAAIQNPLHVFPSAGIYSVNLSVTDIHGCKNDTTHSVNVIPIPDVSFTISQNPGCVDEPLLFQGQSSSQITVWEWDFGDGGYSFVQNPVHAYDTEGDYVVTLSVTDVFGASNSVSEVVYIRPLPTALFDDSSPTCLNEDVYFTDMSYTQFGYMQRWVWNYGDGSSNDTIYAPDNPDVNHIFPTVGVYSVTLEATTSESCSNSFTKSVEIVPVPVADFSYNNTCEGEITSFLDVSSQNGSGIINSWQWNFDDPLSGANNTSSLQNPDHVFSDYGIYNVQLIINTSSACSDTIIKQVTINQSPPVDFEASPACLNELTYFYVDTIVTNPDIITIWHWNFGDGNYSNIQNPSHLYGSDGVYEVKLTVTDTNACTNNVSHTVIVRPLPVSFFDYSSPTCLNDSVYFNDQSYTEYGYIEQWIWDYDDGSPNDTINFPDDPNVYHTFPLEGVFGVTLEVKNSLGCVHSYTRDVTIYPNPIANFYYSDACENEPIDFEDASSPIGPGNIISWYWDFGDPLSGIANTSYLQNPSHLFSSFGIYEVTLIVVNYTQCSDTIIKEVNVKEIPAVDFLYEITCQNQETQFYADSIITNTNSIANWLWDFGDGSTSTLQNPVHIYLLGGDYNVILSVTDTSGCSNSIEHLVTIHSSPEVYFDFSTPCCENNEIEFIDLSSTSSGYICEWIWDFGDGTGDTIIYPNSGNTTHIYSQAGNYLVMLTVTTTDSCFNSDSQTILISSSPIAAYDYEGQCYNEPVYFYDLSIPNGGINIYQWYWDFGDPLSGANNYSYEQNPTHLFSQAGSYNVMLQVTNVGECTDTITQTVDVSEIPDVEFTYSDTNCLGNTTYFYIDTAIVNTSIIAQYIWDFGDGTSYSYLQNPTHIYEFTGDYNVTLTVTDFDGCSNSVSHIVTVNPLPFAVFSYGPACENDTSFFTDHSYVINGEPIISWLWDFGDPDSGPDNYSTLQDPYHIYTQMATYDVKLIVNSESGCTDSITMQLVVNPLPTTDFSYHADACENGLVYFTDLSFAWQTVITDWLWEFEPGYYSTSMNPVYNFYNTDTTYVVSLTVTDGHGCENTKTDSVYIPAGLVFDIEYTDACFGNPTLFNATILQPVGDSLISFSWNFGEPESGPLNYSNEANPSHTYLEAGYYTVSLAAMDINGCVDTVYSQIVVNHLPEPDFTYETFICDNNIYFTDISNGNGASINYWEWDFGDGQDTTYNVFAPVITHNYQNPGFYNVELLVINNNNCSDTVIKEVFREQCLKSVFKVLDTLCCQKFNISFSDSSFHKDIITEWKWDFGDGQDTTYNVFAPVITHNYQQSGLYNVELIVTGIFNDNVLSDTSYKEVEIYATPNPDFIAESVCLNNITNFFDMSLPNGITIVSWEWDFGDNVPGDTSSVRNPVYFYSYADTFDVRLLVTNEMGCYDSIILPAIVHSLPTADFDYSPACLSDPTQFTDLSTNDFGDVTIWNWSFGDTLTAEDTSSLQNPVYVYNYTGGFTVSLIIENQNGCLDTISKDIIVNNIPTSDFTLINNYNNFQGYVKLVNKSTGAISYLWLFGDGNESSEENPIYTFEEDGDYEIQLISFNEFDCTDTLIYDYSLLFKGLFVPNAFSPTDTDPEVSIFKPKGMNLLTYHIQIFNSWGNIIWESTKIDENGSPAEGWDGTYKGELLPLDVYVWKISASFTDGTIWEGVSVGDTDGLSKKTFGTVTLLR